LQDIFGAETKSLTNMTVIPRLKDGDELRPVMRALEEIFQDANNICKIDGNSYLLRRWMNSYEKDSASRAAFHIPTAETIKGYRTTITQITYYIIRSKILQIKLAPDKEPLLVLNTPQTLAIDKLISRIKRHQTSDDEDNRLHLYLMEPLSTLWKEIIEQQINGVNEFSSPLIHCTAILSIDPQSFELSSPSQFSHPMAAIVFAAQILTLRAAFRELRKSRESLLTIYKSHTPQIPCTGRTLCRGMGH